MPDILSRKEVEARLAHVHGLIASGEPRTGEVLAAWHAEEEALLTCQQLGGWLELTRPVVEKTPALSSGKTLIELIAYMPSEEEAELAAALEWLGAK